MRLSNFKFKLPEELIAQFPSRFRDEARLMVIHAKTGEIEHKMMNDLAAYFDEGDMFIANDTKVFPARLYAQKEKTLANIEVFLLRERAKAYEEKTTPSCREQCSGCGANCMGGERTPCPKGGK